MNDPSPNARYLESVQNAWTGEVYGGALFRAAAANTDHADHRAKWLRLADLEDVTRDVLGVVLARHGMAPEAPPDASERGLEIGRRMASQTWSDALGQFQPITGPAIDRFRQIRQACPDEDVSAIEFLIDHEVVLQEFADRELAGDTRGSTTSIDALIATASTITGA